jgi:uncharacterized protein (TIGR02757 family)
MPADIKAFLDECVEQYNCPAFIETDPINIPHRFSRLQDIEIMGFWTAVLAWGQRKTIINSATRLCELMEGAPHDFIINHTESDREKFLSFKHRTFQATDTLYFLEFFQQYYRNHSSLEDAFIPLPSSLYPLPNTIEPALLAFHEYFFSLPDAPARTRKHIPTPARKSTCKRLNMFLRWMVRQDEKGVDFGVWKKIKPAQLLIPLDVHVDRVARQYGLLQREKSDWQAVLELTETLRQFDAEDPVKYDFALFGLGVLESAAMKKGTPRNRNAPFGL